MTNVVCVNVGTKYSEEYVEKLEAMVSQHTKYPFNFVCIRASEFPGWWAKLDLFNKRSERTLYFDLDTVIVGNIDPLFEYNGPFAIIKDWWAHGYNSSVMSIAPSFGRHIRTQFHKDYMVRYHGDQDWITERAPRADLWQTIAPGAIGSYKADHLEDGPEDFSVVCFHGVPKPHEFTEGWVHDAWKV